MKTSIVYEDKSYFLAKEIYDNFTISTDITIIHSNNLNSIMDNIKEYNVIFYLVSNSNIIIKKYNPYALVIGLKQNNTSFVKLLNDTLLKRENLAIAFNDSSFLLFDPLGASWFEGKDIKGLVFALSNRISFLLTMKRDHVYKVDKENILIENEDFYVYARNCADIFQDIIQHADGVTRFLGNASFRSKNYIYMSERDVDKTKIDKAHFIATSLKDNKAYYLGDKKPSKDTIMQLYLYEKLKNINYIVHSHCYIKGAQFTSTPIPCGALNEIDEVINVIKENYGSLDENYYAINLKGHGCLVLGGTLDDMKKAEFVKRNLPENIMVFV